MSIGCMCLFCGVGTPRLPSSARSSLGGSLIGTTATGLNGAPPPNPPPNPGDQAGDTKEAYVTFATPSAPNVSIMSSKEVSPNRPEKAVIVTAPSSCRSAAVGAPPISVSAIPSIILCAAPGKRSWVYGRRALTKSRLVTERTFGPKHATQSRRDAGQGTISDRTEAPSRRLSVGSVRSDPPLSSSSWMTRMALRTALSAWLTSWLYFDRSRVPKKLGSTAVQETTRPRRWDTVWRRNTNGKRVSSTRSRVAALPPSRRAGRLYNTAMQASTELAVPSKSCFMSATACAHSRLGNGLTS